MLTKIALKFRIITIIICIGLITGGLWSATKLQVELLPNIDFPLVTVTAYAPERNAPTALERGVRAPQKVLEGVTLPIESMVTGLEGVEVVRSISSPNFSLVIVEFEYGTDIPGSAIAIQDSIDKFDFPEGIYPPTVTRINPDEFPVLQLSILGDRTLVEVNSIVSEVIVPELQKIPGVYGLDVVSGINDISRTNGFPSASLDITKEPDSNTVTVVNLVLERIQELQDNATIPADIEFIVIANQAPEIQGSIDKLSQEVALGGVLAVLVIFSFLLSFRPTFVTSITIPSSLLIVMIIMYFQDMSLNIMTLGGLAIASGRVVDDSIVVMENIYRHIQKGEENIEAAFNATKEVLKPITVSTITTIAVFLPLGFIDGIIGSFFKPFALTITYALIASLFIALTVVPVLGSYLIKLSQSNRYERSILERLLKIYSPLLNFALKRKAITLLSALFLFILSLGLIPFIPVSFIPGFDLKVLTIKISVPDNSPPYAIVTELDQVESKLELLRESGEILSYASRVGGISEDLVATGSNAASITVAINENIEVDPLAEALRTDLAGANRTILISGASGGGPNSNRLELTLGGPDYAATADFSQKLLKGLENVSDLINVESDVVTATGSMAKFLPITRVNGTRSVTISGVITSPNTQAVNAEVSQIIDSIGLPLNVSLEEGGVFADIQDSFKQMGMAMAFGVVLVYIVMVISQRSLVSPFIIVFSIPLASIGAFGALFITQKTLGLPALMGLLMLIGLVVTNAIVLISFVDDLRRSGTDVVTALIEGGKTRLRPILMTALTTSFVLVPLALESEGQSSGIIGAELATVIIGGLATSTFLTLLVVPVIYSILKKDKIPDSVIIKKD